MTSKNTARRPPPAPYGDVLELIGNTPMIELRRLDTGPCRLFGKLEMLNPAGSIKDRIGQRMIDQAEREGRLRPGGTLVEATAGNTGLALALVAGQRGYKLLVVMPDKMSQEKVDHLRAMGAEVIMTRSDVGKGHPEYYQDLAQRLAREQGAFYVNQFSNQANVDAHYETTGPEIWEQMEGRLDAAVFAVGTGGTLTGAARYLRERDPDIEIILADPVGSILAPLVQTGQTVEPGTWLPEGIGEDFVPDILDLDLVTKAYAISDREAFLVAREVLHREGILSGSSSGVMLAGALRYCREQTEAKRVVTLIPDTGNKYLRKMYSDRWMIDHGFLEREAHGDLRDLIARPHLSRQDFTVSPTETLAVAHGRMKVHDISQLPVLRDDRIVGVIDESDLLMAVGRDPRAFRDPVEEHMVTDLEVLSPDQSIEELGFVLRRGKVALIMERERYLGLITNIDLLSYLRKQAL